MALFSIAATKELDGHVGDVIVEDTPTGSSHNSFGDFAASGEGLRILVDTAQLPTPGDARVAIQRLADHLNELTVGAWPPAAT
jgi:MinD-like ATPase involved in chromosome partitioning or flagellar assembly